MTGAGRDMQSLRILYQDPALIGVYKPPGILSQGDETGDPDAVTLLKQRSGHGRGEFIGLVHRLDRPACGVMVFARTREAAAALSRQIAARQWSKTYLAVVHGSPPQGGAFSDRLIIDRASRTTRTCENGPEELPVALMEYRVLATHRDRSLLQIRLHTGRKHQIRAQLASRGYPVVGDRKYGSREVLRDPGMIALCAWRLEFLHPVTGRPLRLDSPRPLHWPWHDPKLFSGKGGITDNGEKDGRITPGASHHRKETAGDISVKPAKRRKPTR